MGQQRFYHKANVDPETNEGKDQRSGLIILQKTTDLMKYLYTTWTKYPRSEKLGFVTDYKKCLFGFLEYIIAAQKKYFKKTFIGEAEITSLLGNITQKDGEPYIHLHINAADENLNAFGGHLNECVISGTCEMFVDEISGNTGRAYDSETGLNLFDFS